MVKLLAALDFALDAAAARDAVAASPQIAVTAAEKDATVAAPAEKEIITNILTTEHRSGA